MPLPDEKTFFQVDGIKVPVHIFRERRRNGRVSIGKNAVLIRLPANLTPSREQEHLSRFHDWVSLQVRNDQNVRSLYAKRKIENGMKLAMYDRTFVVSIHPTDKRTFRASLKGEEIILHVNNLLPPEEVDQILRDLLARLLAREFLIPVSLKVHELNRRYFQKKLGKVSLKNMHSRWGSCTIKKGNINLATRLLFAPEPVLDYVIIHELAHLIEPNHSPRFWTVVENVLPEYREMEKWLEKNAHQCLLF